MPYPVSVIVEPALTNRNRLTTAFRLILAIPHLILVGGIGFGSAAGGNDGSTSAGSDYIVDPAGPRNRLTIALRLLLAVPHFVVLVFVLAAWGLTTIAAWFIILFTGTYPRGLYEFGIGAFRWRLRVDAYLLLLVDEYPPFSLSGDSGVRSLRPHRCLASRLTIGIFFIDRLTPGDSGYRVTRSVAR